MGVLGKKLKIMEGPEYRFLAQMLVFRYILMIEAGKMRQ
jgi:hypothetical protein